MAKQEIALGQTYQPPLGMHFSRPSPSWVVRDMFVAIDGLLHVRLICSNDGSLSKTVGADALSDSRLFRLVQN